MTNFYSFFIEDVKAAGRVLEFSENYIKFDNGIQYRVAYRTNEGMGKEGYEIYEIYRGEALITDKMSGVFFDYNNESEYIKVRLYYEDDELIKNGFDYSYKKYNYQDRDLYIEYNTDSIQREKK